MLLRPPSAFPSDLFWSPCTTRSLNDPGPIKTVDQPAHCTPSRYAIYGSTSLQRHAGAYLTGSCRVQPPPFFILPSVAAVDYSLQHLRVRVKFCVFNIFPSVLIFQALVQLVGFSSCPVLGPRDYTRYCVGILLQRTSHWFRSPFFRTWATNLSCLRFLFLLPIWYSMASLS